MVIFDSKLMIQFVLESYTNYSVLALLTPRIVIRQKDRYLEKFNGPLETFTKSPGWLGCS